MKPPKSIPEFREKIQIKEVMAIMPAKPGRILTEFDNAKNKVITKLLSYLLEREPKVKDFEMIDLVDSNCDKTWKEVYYCDVKIGRIFGNAPNGIVEAIENLDGFFIYFHPDEEYL